MYPRAEVGIFWLAFAMSSVPLNLGCMWTDSDVLSGQQREAIARMTWPCLALSLNALAGHS
jgi:hypothetical protein